MKMRMPSCQSSSRTIAEFSLENWVFTVGKQMLCKCLDWDCSSCVHEESIRVSLLASASPWPPCHRAAGGREGPRSLQGSSQRPLSSAHSCQTEGGDNVNMCECIHIYTHIHAHIYVYMHTYMYNISRRKWSPCHLLYDGMSLLIFFKLLQKLLQNNSFFVSIFLFVVFPWLKMNKS